MSSTGIQTVGIVGCGTMGSGIAAICARAGYEVVIWVLDAEHAEAGHDRIVSLLTGTPSTLSSERHEVDLQTVSFVTESAGLADADLVIEAVPEDLDTKRGVFAELGRVCPHGVILATNTSSLPVISLATASGLPDQVLGLHFFNPPSRMQLVELAETVASSPEIRDRAKEFAESLGKTVVVCRDRPGFIANLLLFPYLNEAANILDAGRATREDIDLAMRLGAGHPMGPLELVDLIGLDACMQVLDSLQEQFREPRYQPSPALRHLVTAGYTGRKAGKGFYTYRAPGSPEIVEDGRSAARARVPSTERSVQLVGVLGTGTVGAGVAEVAGRAGFRVVAWGRADSSIRRGKKAVEGSTARAVEGGRLTHEERVAVLDSITWTTDLDDLYQADLLIEALSEDLELKKETFAKLGTIVKEDAVFSSATSSLPVVELATASGRPDRMLGLHFFNPVPSMRLVEVVRTVATSDATVATAVKVLRRMGKKWITCEDRAGFIVNRLLFPYLNDAVKMYEAGYASGEDIDTAMTLGCNHPVGPLALMDLVGLDVALEILRALYREYGESGAAPAPLLEHMVQAGFLGKKVGRGFRTGTAR